ERGRRLRWAHRRGAEHAAGTGVRPQRPGRPVHAGRARARARRAGRARTSRRRDLARAAGRYPMGCGARDRRAAGATGDREQRDGSRVSTGRTLSPPADRPALHAFRAPPGQPAAVRRPDRAGGRQWATPRRDGRPAGGGARAGAFLRHVLFEEIPAGTELPADAAAAFARTVLERFRNPWLDHEWRVIATNQTAKLRLRVAPVIAGFARKRGLAPQGLTLACAAY